MRLFEIQPGEVAGKEFNIWHLDLDHVASIQELRYDSGPAWWVEMTGGRGFNVTKELFDRIMGAWESK